MLSENNTLDQAAVAQWQSTVTGDRLVPLTYSLRPITDAMQGIFELDMSIIANVNRSLRSRGSRSHRN